MDYLRIWVEYPIISGVHLSGARMIAEVEGIAPSALSRAKVGRITSVPWTTHKFKQEDIGAFLQRDDLAQAEREFLSGNEGPIPE